MDSNLNNNTQLNKKQKKMEFKLNNNNKLKVTSSLTHNDFLVYEILTRLPVKTLFRFKTVSKEWCSLIEKDENFIHSHLLTHSKTNPRCCIFIVVPVPFTKEGKSRDSDFELSHWPCEEFHITADLVFEDNGSMKAVVDTVREVDSTNYDMITNPVNGLFCSIESQLERDVRICNISTGQVSPSFPSTLSEEPKRRQYGIFYELKYKCDSFNYGFGFDPATNEHKLVWVWRVRPYDYGGDNDDLSCYICEVLTLGIQCDINSWRRINVVPPPYELTEDSVYVNGVIYWSTYGLRNGFWKFCSIVAFDAGKEKFRTITVPDLILAEAACYCGVETRYNRHVSLLEVSGRLAMLIRMNHSVFKMYIYEDDDYKKEVEEDINKASSSTSSSSNNKERWIEVGSIRLPLDFKESCVKFHTFVGSDDKIIATFFDGRDCGKKKCTFFYCFNWKKDSWTEFEVSGIPSSVPHICFRSSFTTSSESLLPVNN